MCIGKVVNHFTANRESKVVIYGYSVNGRLIAGTLKHHATEVAAFIDRNATQLGDTSKTEILSPDKAAEYFAEQLDDLIVIIAIANVFEHRPIAMQLQQHGFKNVLFFPDFSFNQGANEVKQMKKAFEEVREGKCFHGEILATFGALQKHLNTNVIEKTTDSVTAFVPIELIHIGTQQLFPERPENDPTICGELEKLPYYFNTPLAGFNYYLDLYDFFEGKNEKGCDSYFAWKRAMNKGIELTASDKKRMLEDRRSVYRNMADALAINDSFFRSNPVELEFNGKGYFYLVDGANRTCFYIHKGLRFIPARIDRDSYNAWVNTKRLSEGDRQWIRGQELLRQYPIHEHPMLCAPGSSASFVQHDNYIALCRFLSAHAICLTDRSVLVINSTNSYFSLFFSRMGVHLTSHVSDNALGKYNEIVNKLCASGKIDIVVGSLEDMLHTYPYDIVVYLDKGDAELESSTDTFIRNCQASLFFWILRSCDSADCIKMSFSDYSCKRLHRFCGDNQQYYDMFAFYKGEVPE
jgi:hypothetical protein